MLILDGGTAVEVPYARVPDSPGGVIFDFNQVEYGAPVPRRARRLSQPAEDSTALGAGPVLVRGEPGTGRSCLARQIAGDDAEVLSAHDELTTGTSAWVLRARQLLESGQPVVIDDVHLLSPGAAGLLAKLVATSARIVSWSWSPAR